VKPEVFSELHRARILVVGDVMLDRYWYGDVSRISPEAPVPIVRIETKRTKEVPGGAANVAANAAALGASVALLSVVGDDEPGRKLAQLVAEKRVETNLHRDRSIDTTVKLRVIGGRQQQMLRIDFETAPSHEVLLGKLDDYRRMIVDRDIVILSDYGKGGLTHIAQMIEIARGEKKTVLVDPKGDDYSKYVGATVMTPNRSELREVMGAWKDDRELEAKAQAFRERLGLRALLVTLGADGMTLFQAGSARHEPAREQHEVIDVSGAGDTVIATLAVMLGVGTSLEEAMVVANVAAGIKVLKFGTAVVQPKELSDALARA
jgi:D-glycero-beta-D-manno-heptose-7-phosphate kinase